MIMKRVTWWDNLREATFEKWSDKYLLPDEPGKIIIDGQKFYQITALDNHFKTSKDYDDQQRKNHPVRWFFLQSVPNALEFLITILPTLYQDVKFWIRYRTTEKYHIVNTGLKPGYYDTDNILTAAMWALLVDFVEVECAWMNIRFESDKAKRTEYYKHRTTLFQRKVRVSEMGLDYLNFQIESDSRKTKPYNEIIAAYNFYKSELPALETELKAAWEEDIDYDNPVQRKENYKRIDTLEAKIHKLSTKHLSNIVKHRSYLWT